jgi:hypothetical protein
MIAAITCALSGGVLFTTGFLSQAYVKLIDAFMRLAYRVFGVTKDGISRHEKTIPASIETQEQFGEIKKMRKSKENSKFISSVSYIGICIVVLAVMGILMNLNAVTGSIISNGISELLGLAEPTIAIYWTSTMFAFVTLGCSIMYGQWKKGKEFRKEHNRNKLKQIVKNTLTEQELIDIVDEKVKDKK